MQWSFVGGCGPPDTPQQVRNLWIALRARQSPYIPLKRPCADWQVHRICGSWAAASRRERSESDGERSRRESGVGERAESDGDRSGVERRVGVGVGSRSGGLVVRAAGSCNSVATLSRPSGGLILSAA